MDTRRQGVKGNTQGLFVPRVGTSHKPKHVLARAICNRWFRIQSQRYTTISEEISYTYLFDMEHHCSEFVVMSNWRVRSRNFGVFMALDVIIFLPQLLNLPCLD